MRKRAIRFLALTLILVLVLGLCPTALAAAGLENFEQVNTFRPGQFTDLPAAHWGYENVKTAYELGLMKGESDTAFAPDGGLTVAAAITLSARIHSIYHTGTEHFVQGSPWYRCYVDYALQNGLITREYGDYDAYIRRWEFAQILGRALPDGALPVISTVDDGAIPDVPMSAGYAADVYRLYRAGILTGRDDGSFAPDTGILRSEAAAIVSRMAEPELRKNFVLLNTTPYVPALMAYRQAAARASQPDFDWVEDALPVIREWGYVRYYPRDEEDQLYYCFQDLDGNGKVELLIGVESRGKMWAVDIFCLDGNEPVHLLPVGNNFGNPYCSTTVFADGSLLTGLFSNDGGSFYMKGRIASDGHSFTQTETMAARYAPTPEDYGAYIYYHNASYYVENVWEDGMPYYGMIPSDTTVDQETYSAWCAGDSAVHGREMSLPWEAL
jgi:hypothetical protein